MNNLAKRSLNTLFILVFIVLTFASIAYSIKIGSEVRNYEPEVAEQFNLRLQQICTRQLTEAGFTIPDSNPGSVTAHYTDALKDPTLSMTLSSAAIQSCPGYALEHFCMGPECNDNLEFTLRLQ